MKEYKRAYPLFSLCGLNCGLCPRFHTEGSSKCPGCGGNGFHLKHPSCVVITCNKKHDDVEFCFQCSTYPCGRYCKEKSRDSFITYTNVDKDMKAASRNFEKFRTVLEEKIQILELLLNGYNDGRRKNFYCCAVNLLPLSDLREIMNTIRNEIDTEEIGLKEKVECIVSAFSRKADERNVQLILRK